VYTPEPRTPIGVPASPTPPSTYALVSTVSGVWPGNSVRANTMNSVLFFEFCQSRRSPSVVASIGGHADAEPVGDVHDIDRGRRGEIVGEVIGEALLDVADDDQAAGLVVHATTDATERELRRRNLAGIGVVDVGQAREPCANLELRLPREPAVPPSPTVAGSGSFCDPLRSTPSSHRRDASPV
jgi:hypothetical protein